MVGVEAHKTSQLRQPLERVELPEEEIRWCSVGLREAIENGLRLKAAVFGIEGRHAREVLENCRWPICYVTGEGGLARAFHLPRFKRVWLEKSELPIYQPGQITELNPRPSGYLSPITKTDIDALRVSQGQILMTCSGRSGSIGRTAYVSGSLHGRIFSHDLIRIECTDSECSGYVWNAGEPAIIHRFSQKSKRGAASTTAAPLFSAIRSAAQPPQPSSDQVPRNAR